MGYILVAIADATVDDAIARVLAPLGWERDARWVSPYDLDDTECACFRLGAWTFILMNGRDQTLGTLAFANVVAVTCSDDDWSEVSVSAHGVRQWSIHGADDDDRLRSGGAVPDPFAHYLNDDDANAADRARVAIDIARELTGFAVDDRLPATVRIVQLSMNVYQPTLPTGDKELELAFRPREQGADRIVFDITPTDENAWPPRFDTVSRREGQLLAHTGEDHALSIDTTTFPPTLSLPTSAACTGAAFTPWQTVVVAVEETAGHLYELGGARVGAIEIPFEHVASLHDVGVGVVAFPKAWSDGHAVPLLIAQGAPAIPLPVEPAREGMADPIAAGFGDGSCLLVWLGRSYRWDHGALVEMQSLTPRSGRDTAATLADGSIVVACEHALVRIWPDDRREPVELFADPQAVVRGPSDAVIVIDKDPEHCLKIWWTASNEVTSLGWQVFDLDWDPELVYYDAARELLVILAKHLHAVPWRVIAAQRR